MGSGTPDPHRTEPKGEVDPYYAFDESWGPTTTRKRKPRHPAPAPAFWTQSEHPPFGSGLTWLAVLLAVALLALLVAGIEALKG